MSFELDEALKDAFLEIANIGVGRAAASMSILAGKKVNMTVPEVLFTENHDEEMKVLEQAEPSLLVEQAFTHDITGVSHLVLNKSGAKRLAELILDKTEEETVFGAIEQGAILELGNIMICGLLSNLANMVGMELYYEVPELQLNGIQGGDQLTPKIDSFYALLKCFLSIEEDSISGFLIISMSKEDFERVINEIRSKYFAS